MKTKVCTKCGIEQNIENFGKDISKKDGYRPSCRKCKSLNDSAYRNQNENKLKEKDKIVYLKNRKEKIERSKAYYKLNKEKILNKRKEEYYLDIDLSRKKKRACYHKTSKFKRKDYCKRQRALILEINSRRRAAKINATPNWLTKEMRFEIKKFYQLALNLKNKNNVNYHVDHIIPLQGKTVCGLHVPWNLQVITEFENISKHNKLI